MKTKRDLKRVSLIGTPAEATYQGAGRGKVETDEYGEPTRCWYAGTAEFAEAPADAEDCLFSAFEAMTGRDWLANSIED